MIGSGGTVASVPSRRFYRYVSDAFVSEPSGIALSRRRNSLAAVLGSGAIWLEVSVQDQRIEIKAVGPHDGAMVDGNLSEEGGILQRLKNWTPEFVGEIDITNDAVVEAQVEAVRRPHLDRGDFGDRGDLLGGRGLRKPGR
ncbi:MAG: hypothetical protein QOJ23_3189 [Actinomycetota bacterium]|jgi:hypothetical protein|nr:hypothetical protein [Actinomycetota bacterium]